MSVEGLCLVELDLRYTRREMDLRQLRLPRPRRPRLNAVALPEANAVAEHRDCQDHYKLEAVALLSSEQISNAQVFEARSSQSLLSFQGRRSSASFCGVLSYAQAVVALADSIYQGCLRWRMMVWKRCCEAQPAEWLVDWY